MTRHRHGPMRRRSARATRAARGVSLIELLVGIVVGMLTVLAITQLFLESEKQRRVPAAGADAQVNGILALDAIQRDVRQAGYGLGGGPWLGGCTTADLDEAKAVGLSNLPLAPVTITAGSPSDTIEVLSSGKIDAAMQVKLTANHPDDDDEFILPSTLGFEVGDWLVIATKTGSTCAAFQVAALSASEPWTLTATGDVPLFDEGSLLSNMGAAPIRRRWSIAGSATSTFALQMTNLATASAAAADDAYPDVVLLRAFYAKDTDNDGAIDTYDTTPPATRAEWNQVIGLRLALVVRSAQWDKEEVTTSAPLWNLGSATTVTGSSACAGDSSSKCITLGLTHTVATGSNDWKHYRYRTYDSLIPLRNLLWNAGVS